MILNIGNKKLQVAIPKVAGCGALQTRNALRYSFSGFQKLQCWTQREVDCRGNLPESWSNTCEEEDAISASIAGPR